jgi:hypothetical protein
LNFFKGQLFKNVLLQEKQDNSKTKKPGVPELFDISDF